MDVMLTALSNVVSGLAIILSGISWERVRRRPRWLPMFCYVLGTGAFLLGVVLAATLLAAP